jgi:hypothetical protein
MPDVDRPLTPWMLDQDNNAGIVITDDRGNVVHAVSYADIPSAASADCRADIIRRERANAHAMVTAINVLYGC